jgi:hypothetical protein
MQFISIEDNFLNNELFNECLYFSNITFTTDSMDSFDTNKTCWEDDMIKDSATIYIKRLDYGELYNKIKESISLKLDIDTLKCINFYWYSPGSHIPWHNDSTHNGGITIYLNDWDIDNGGLFLFNDKNDGIRAIVPKRNRLIQQFGRVDHSVMPTTTTSIPRKTIQIFY